MTNIPMNATGKFTPWLQESVAYNVSVHSDDQVTLETPNSTTLHVPYESVISIPWVRSIFIILYSIIFVMGLCGNSLVIYVVSRNKAMQTITNIFITNLAASDVLICLLAVPFTPVNYFVSYWPLGDFLCHLIPMVLGVTVYVSTLTSIAIAVDRFFVIIHPFKSRMKSWLCLLLIFAIWVVSITISMPLAIYNRLVWNPHIEVYECQERWSRVSAERVYTVVNLLFQYIIPCVIITYCYTKVSISLENRSKFKKGKSSREREEIEIKRKRRTNRMLIAMVAIFVCCWMPLQIFQLITQYNGEEMVRWKYYGLVFFIAHITAMSSTIYNPFLYSWMNENFRKEFKQAPPFAWFGRHLRRSNLNLTQYVTVDTQNSTVVRQSPQTEARGSCDGGATFGTPTCSVEDVTEQGTSCLNSVAYNASTNSIHLK